ncbi:Glycosyl hydrolase family 61 [Aspergillus fischeri NRRL 181]|uniref:AA9 family lytic polysaccharide monooxygenase n=1 Tax=Neosartorya fischeri (strain ATCC 1020 / DSM 3700 / CBS 544.65 / FGSC A1164 / JCM 1740 / NRRL 181 / WB 181) TaxID=331117 RepID=A1CV43_NEOFI|nr:Glycosyl hydrolase family 61 [Aspergillus fischeri NRRL 181]EAW25620.1 Glycosyl hydrolase family 61 [Aspergillus fischeri NRRL 181]KAG2001589.1 hypothetical protein GB937_010031 [Aspergillus fischeri]
MSQTKSLSLLAVLLSATRVAAHGHVTNVVVNGVSYAGFDINSYPYMSDPPKVAAWTTPNTGNGFIAPSAYNSPDIICHQNATNAQAYIEIAAGDRIQLQWTAWPESHHGPVIDMLASCGESCTTVDKTSLKFFKIDGVGLVDNSAVPGTWGDDQLIANSNSWMVEIPKSIAPGNYVLRHELIALHGAFEEGGAQNYPQCFNLKVTGSGTDSPAGTLGTELYTESDPGLLVDIYKSIASYAVPGPAMYSGAVSITQTTSAITSTGTATVGSGADSTPVPSSAASSKYSTIAVQVPTTKAQYTPVPSSSPSTFVTSPAPSTPVPSSSSVPVTSSTAAPQPTPAPGGTQTAYGQCGGRNWTGPTACASGSTCKTWNPYYSQCVPN